MGRRTLRMIAGATAVVLIVLSSVAFTVRERHAVIVTRFGEPLRTLEDPGLHWKLPWPIDRTVTVDGRSRVFNTRHGETLTGDAKSVVLLSYAVWHVADPLRFHRAVGTMEAADEKLDGLITASKIGVLGRYELDRLVSTDPEALRVTQIETEILAAAGDVAREQYGITIEQIGLKRLSLPAENTAKVFERMREERRQYSEAERAEGDRRAAEIRAETDLQTRTMLAEARREAERTRGEGEAEAARILAEAARLDPALFRFWMSLRALPETLGEQSTVILRTDSAPFHLLKGTGLGGDPALDFDPLEPAGDEGDG